MTNIIEMAERGRNKARFAGTAHHIAAGASSRKNILLGVPVVILSSIVATSIFGSISETPPSDNWKLAAGFVSLAAAVLSALQTFFRFAEQAQKHLTAAADFLMMRRRFDVFLVRYDQKLSKNRNRALDDLESMLQELENIAKNAPVLSPRVYERSKRDVIRSERAAAV